MQVRLTIKKVCQKLGIKYTSGKEANINTYKKDIQVLANIYIQLKEIIVQLQEIEMKRATELQVSDYPINHDSILAFKAMLHRTIQELDNVDHEIKKEATQLLHIKKEKNEV